MGHGRFSASSRRPVLDAASTGIGTSGQQLPAQGSLPQARRPASRRCACAFLSFSRTYAHSLARVAPNQLRLRNHSVHKFPYSQTTVVPRTSRRRIALTPVTRTTLVHNRKHRLSSTTTPTRHQRRQISRPTIGDFLMLLCHHRQSFRTLPCGHGQLPQLRQTLLMGFPQFLISVPLQLMQPHVRLIAHNHTFPALLPRSHKTLTITRTTDSCDGV